MNRPSRRGWVGAVAIVGSLAAVLYTARADSNAPAPPSTRPVARFVPAFAAMDYYDTSCAHCHGPYGSFYGPTLGNDLTDAALTKKCHAMEIGPAGSPISDEQNGVVVAYHRSLIMRLPYVSVTDTSTVQWTGEVTPGAKVILDLPAVMIPVVVTDFTWTATLPPNTNPVDVTVEAELKGKVTTLKLGDSAFSSTAPLPPPVERHR